MIPDRGRSLFIVPKPNPIERRIISPAAAGHIRKLHCRRQSECLMVAMKEKWSGMSCEKCDVEEPLTREEVRADTECMARMWGFRESRERDNYRLGIDPNDVREKFNRNVIDSYSMSMRRRQWGVDG